MAARDLTAALAQLFTDSELRERFRRDPEAVAELLELESESRPTFCNLNADELERQADCLISKRCHEVSQILPQTWERLGWQEARQLFYQFAATFWPEGHQRHFLDALAFCVFLKRRKISGLVKSEWNWLRFCQSDGRLRIHFVRDLIINGHPYFGLQFFYRRSQKPRWFVIRFPRRFRR